MNGWVAINVFITSLVFTQFIKKYIQPEWTRAKKIIAGIGYLILSFIVVSLAIGILRAFL